MGGGGQVARAVAATAPAGHAVVLKTETDLDITNPAALAAQLKLQPVDWIVNGAAYTAVDQAEDDVAKATLINDTAVGVLAQAAREAGSRLMHISTDFVFDGESNRAYLPGDPPNPISVYGVTKLGGERQALAAGTGGIVVRTAWVYAAVGKNFVLTMLKLMRERERLSVVADQIGTPTHATGLARALWGLMENQAPGGLYHWTDLGVASWYDFAVAIQEEGLARGLLTRAVPIEPIGSAAYPTKARRPHFSVLNTESARAVSKAPARHWRENLREMLYQLGVA